MKLITMMEALRSVSGSDWQKLSREKLEEIRTSAYYAPHLEKMRRKADACAEKPLRCIPYSSFKMFDRTGSRTEFQEIHREHRAQLAAYTTAAVLDGTHLNDLEDIIWAICDEYSWCNTAHFRYGGTNIPSLMNPAPTAENKMEPYLFEQPQVIDLSASLTAGNIAEVLALLGDKLAPAVVYRARKCIRERVLEPFMAINKPFWWETTPMNWAVVCGSGVGMAAMYMIDDPEMLAPVLTRCTEAAECYLSGFKSDGVCAEGLGYWVYGFGHFVIYAEILKRRTGGKIDLFKEEIAARVARFYTNTLMNGNNAVCFADCHEKTTYPRSTLHLLHSVYPDVVIPPEEYASPMDGDLRDFLWTDPSAPTGSAPDGDIFYDETQWMICRRTFPQCRAVFAAKGGCNDEPHNHNDLGSYVLDVDGEILLGDLGGGMYTRQYFSDERYTMLITSSKGHPVPVVDGTLQAFGKEYAVCGYRTSVDEMSSAVLMDLSGGYPDAPLASLVRRLQFSKTAPCITLQDTFGWKASPCAVTERFTTKFEPAVQEDGSVLIRGKKSAVRIRGKAACSWTVTEDEYAESEENLHQKVWLIDTVQTPAEGETLLYTVTVEK